ncbi:MAG: hypothetical protein GY803_03075 [Chloroflexi bacterium]|nr:hypothetical protein [Chloroflexota bacterium]
MRSRRSYLVLLLLITAVLLFFFLSRRETQAEFGSAIALCPGPDMYGYACAGGGGFAYIDAAYDTQLYADDAVILLELPFPYTFYGTVYNEIHASSNGTLQFGGANPSFINECLADQPAAGMGDMIAPYWDDLDLQLEGFLETETVGEAPNRIFVVEWDDVPRYGDPEDRVTFAVQLFEGSNDIVFLYEDVTTFEGHNGGNATIGLQSEAQELALQFSCNQAAVANAGRVHFVHPAEPNPDVGAENVGAEETAVSPPSAIIAKGVTADLLAALNQRDATILTQLQSEWRRQTPRRAAVWEWIDLTGNGRAELVLLWHGGPQRPGLAQLVILTADEEDKVALALDEQLSTRSEPVGAVAIVETADLTHDGRPDLLAQDDNGRLWAVTAVNDIPARYPIPHRCQGGLTLLDTDENGRLDIVRDGCDTEGRVIVEWDGRQFTAIAP